MNRRHISVGLILIVVLTGYHDARAQSVGTVTEAAVLRPGDRIRITVREKPNLSGEFQISGDSTIADPFYQELKVAGVRMSTAADRIRSHVARYETNPLVLIEPLLRVAVVGEVRQPGVYWLEPETTTSLAVMLAGGPTERGRLNRVQLLRDHGSSTVDLLRPQTGAAGEPIRSGDQIIVQRQGSLFRDYVGPTAAVLGVLLNIVRISRI